MFNNESTGDLMYDLELNSIGSKEISMSVY